MCVVPKQLKSGSGVIKAGFAGDQIPKYCFPNYVGRPKHVRVMAGALEGDIFIGPKAERACYLSINPQKDETLETEKAQYYLPDGSTIEIGPSRFRAPELLFRPDLIGEESEGIHEVLVFAIQKSDMDLRRTLFSNIVLSGGSTLFKGFGDRLLSEVKKLAPKDVKIRISAPQERLYSTWIGGSILASLDTFKKMWVSKKEYEEDGARSIHRKTF
ncbi:hypothetical protein MC885_017594 [Smutsia gigantea]|nr:hypothetical protein MC885_017594 [Smutsia gigantea]